MGKDMAEKGEEYYNLTDEQWETIIQRDTLEVLKAVGEKIDATIKPLGGIKKQRN